VREEVQRFRVLRPATGWTEDAIWDCTQAFFVEKGAAVTTGVLTQTTDAASMGRYLRRSIRNYLISEARQTDRGAVRRKIEDLLTATPDFTTVPAGAPGAGRWQLAREVTWPPYGGELEPLVTAAYAVPGVQAVRWSGPRRAPLATDESLIAILEAVLAAAGGSMEPAELTWVLLQRFPAAAEVADAVLDHHVFERTAAPAEQRPDVLVEGNDDLDEVSARAADVYGQLSPAQRVLLPHLDAPITDVMKVLGVGRSQAYATVGKLKATLPELVPEDGLRRDVMLEVLRLCQVDP
jgi:hypothetical protein